VQQPRIVIIGGGIIGLSTAYTLLCSGIEDVTVLEQAVIDHEQASSHGISRLLRFEYGSDTLYSQMVQLSLQRWQRLEHIVKRKLYTPTGLLVLGSEQDEYTRSSYSVLRKLGYTPERLTHEDCEHRFPQFNTQDFDLLTFNMNAGMLHASMCLQALRACIIALGGTILEHHRVTHIDNDRSQAPIRLHISNGKTIIADRIAITAGPWVHRLLGAMNLPVRLTRQYLLYFSDLPIERYNVYNFPAFIADDLYGFPLHKTGNPGPLYLKAASHSFGAPAIPDEVPPVDENVIQQVTSRLYHLLPELEQARLAKVESYIYDVSHDEDFILDYLPQDHRIVFATGLTGHGFKFGLLLGEIMTSLLCETASIVPLDRFRLMRFSPTYQTPVHSVA
jgi:monomeric sarcosine oxidase